MNIIKRCPLGLCPHFISSLSLFFSYPSAILSLLLKPYLSRNSTKNWKIVGVRKVDNIKMDWNEKNRSNYDSLSDRYLRDYFTLPQVKTQLLKVGLMTKDGRILSEEEYKRATIRRQQRWAARQQLARRMAMEAREKHLSRQLELQKQLETVSRVELYRKMKGESKHSDLISITPLELERTFSRSQSAPSFRAQQATGNSDEPSSILPLVSPEHHFNSSGYHSDDERPRSELPSQEEQAQRKRALRRRYLRELDRYQLLHKLDNESLERYDAYLRLQLSRLERARLRPFAYAYSEEDEITHVLTSVEPEAGLPEIPDRPIDSLYKYRGWSVNNRPRWRHLQLKTPRGNEADKSISEIGGSTQRTRSESPSKVWQNKPVASRLYITSAAAAGKRRRQPLASCECFLQYIGPARNANGEQSVESGLHKISITQQHCGGNVINVFNGDLMSKAKFEFISYRQRGYPFSLILTEDSSNILRISTCCESRYPVGTKLGGKKGSFKWQGVKNAVPCYKCQMYRGLEAPYSNYETKPIKQKSVSLPKPVTRQIRIEKKPKLKPPTPPKRQQQPISPKKRPNVKVKSEAVAGGAVAVAAAAALSAEDGQEHQTVSNNEQHQNGGSPGEEDHSGSESENASESGTESESESASGSDSEEEEDDGEGSQKSSVHKDVGSDHSVQGEEHEHSTSEEESDQKDESSEHANTDQNQTSSAEAQTREDEEHEKDDVSGKVEDSHNDATDKSEKGTKSSESDGTLTASDAEHENASAGNTAAAGTSVSPKHEEASDGGTETGSSASERGSGDSEDSESENDTNSQATVKLTERENDTDESVSKKEKNDEEADAGEKDTGPGGSHGSIENARQEYHDAGIQPDGPIEHGETSESGSESGSSEGDTGEEQSRVDKGASEQNGDNKGLTERLKSASAAMLSAENHLIGGQDGDSQMESASGQETGANQESGNASQTDAWYCSICNFDNDSDLHRCRICGVPRESQSTSVQSQPNPAQAPITPSHHSIGPWTCHICNFDNDADLERCRVCGVVRNTLEATPAHENAQKLQNGNGNGETGRNEEWKTTEDATAAAEGNGKGEDDEDTLADAESIRNEPSESQEMRNQDEGNVNLLGPSISVIPPSKKPSVSDADTREHSIGENGIGDDDKQEMQNGEGADYSTTQNQSAAVEMEKGERDAQSGGKPAPTDRECSGDMMNGESAPEDEDHADNANAGEVDSDGEKRHAISARLQEACNKEDVVISNVELNESAIGIITEQLKQNQDLRSISIRNSHLTEDNLAAIEGVLSSIENPQIKGLNFNMNDLGGSAMPRVINMVRQYQIESLLLRGNSFGDSAIADLFKELADLNCVKKLDVGENQISHDSTRAVCDLLDRSDILQALSLGGNAVFDLDDWKAIARGFLKNKTLETINLDYCRMGDEAVELVCVALKNNPMLKSIDLDGNDITDRGAGAVLELVDSLPNLTSVVWTAGNRISPNALQLVRQVLQGRS